MKSSEAFIKTSSIPTSLSCKGQAAKPTRACLKHEMAKWRNGEIAKWRNGEMELKPRATVIKYDRSTEISICCRIYFVVNRHK